MVRYTLPERDGMPEPKRRVWNEGRAMECTLCKSDNTQLLKVENDPRYYFLCEECSLIFVDPYYYLSPEPERARYLEHDNGLHHRGYVNFLQRIIRPSLQYITPEMKGLDYGCGPEPTLSKLLARQSIRCYDYDPLFDFDHPLEIYDFVFATECMEHFHRPYQEWQNISELIKGEGILSIMTEQWETLGAFRDWYYKRDLTHISFYHAQTFECISQHFGYDILYRDRNRSIILKKN